MKPTDVNLITYIDFGAKNNDKGPKFEVGDNVKYQNMKILLLKVTFHIEGFVIEIMKKIGAKDLNGEKIVGMFQKTNRI